MITSIDKQKYPDYFPDNCPPADCCVDERVLFRFCNDKEVSKDDFRSYYLMNPDKYRNNILAYGLSILKSREDCISLYRKCPYMRGHKSIAKGITNAMRGCWQETPSKRNPNHITWWVCVGIRPETFFEIDYCFGD